MCVDNRREVDLAGLNHLLEHRCDPAKVSGVGTITMVVHSALLTREDWPGR